MLPTDASRFQAQLTPTLAPDSPTRLLRPIRPLTDPSPCPRSQKGAPALPNLKTCPIPSLAQSLTQHDPCYRRNQQAILWNNGTRRPIDGMFVDDSVCEVVPKGSTWGALAHVSRPTLIARTNPSSSSGAHPWGGARTQVIPARCAADQPPRPPFDTGCTQHRPSSPSPTQPHPASPSLTQPHPASPSLTQPHPAPPSATPPHLPLIARYQLPISPKFECGSLVIDKCKCMDSKKAPLWLVWRNADPIYYASEGSQVPHTGGETLSFMFKSGDDLRQ